MKKLYQLKIDSDDVIEMLNRYSHLEYELSSIVTRTLVVEEQNEMNMLLHSVTKVISDELKRIREINLEITDEKYSSITIKDICKRIEKEMKSVEKLTKRKQTTEELLNRFFMKERKNRKYKESEVN